MHDWCNGYGNVNLGYGKWVDFAKFLNKHGEALLLPKLELLPLTLH